MRSYSSIPLVPRRFQVLVPVKSSALSAVTIESPLSTTGMLIEIEAGSLASSSVDELRGAWRARAAGSPI